MKAELEFDVLTPEEKLSYLAQLEREMHLPRGDRALAKRLAESG